MARLPERLAPVAVALLVVACGGEATISADEDFGVDAGADVRPEPSDMPSADMHSDDAGPSIAPDLGGDPDLGQPPPVPEQLRPCDQADCWETELGGVPCSSAAHDEDFSSGNYNVHRYESFVWDGTPTSIELVGRSGSWDPVLVLTEPSGTTLFDGDVPLTAEGILVEAQAGNDIVLTSDTPRRLEVFVTSRAVLESGFVDRIPTDATYALTVTSTCSGERAPCVVNGNDVREPACGWLHYVGRRVVPHLPGSRERRVDVAAVVSWWALKEGVMFLQNPIVYSNCNFPDGDARIGPLDSCVDRRAWQVGLSGVQVPWHSDADVQSAVDTAYPGRNHADTLRGAALRARLDDVTVQAVVDSTGTLRRSWFLRDSVVGFMLEEPVVRAECIEDTRSWCYGTGWDATRMYAPNRTGALQAIEDIKGLLDVVAP